MTSVAVDNQFAALQSSPRDDGKEELRSRKDDLKEQAFQAREGIKNKAVSLKEQVIASSSGIVAQAQSQLASGIDLAKQKLSAVTGTNLQDKSTQEIVEEVTDAAPAEWETVKRKGKAAGKKALADAQEQVDATIDEKLTPAQKQKLNKGVRQVKAAGKQGLRQAEGWFDTMLSAPQLRPVKTFIVRNNLQLPAMIFMAIASLWLGLTLIRLITTFTSPSVPEFDIHDKEASMNWLKYHAGEYKGKATDMKDSLSGRVASFLANHELDKIKENAIDWKDIGMKRLGLAEPTYTEQLWGWITGRPVTWQGRVESVLNLAKTGLKASALKQGLNAGSAYLKNGVKDTLGMQEPSLLQRATDYVTGHDSSLKGRANEKASGIVDSIKSTLSDSYDSIREVLPGGAAAAEAARQKAYAATHRSTLDNIKSGAEYVKNRIVHGAQEAAHIAQDRANEAADNLKYKTGL